MARPSIPVDVIGNTAQLRKQIEELSKTPVILNNVQVARGKAAGGIQQQSGAISNLNAGLAAGSAAATSFNRPLGRISGNLSEIDKSLGAANARVIAFGASAAAIFAVQNAVEQLFTSFVNTEKKLAEINTVLNLDQGGLKSFGKQIFKTAGQTGQSFDVASEAALEFSRQGLGVEETTKRTRDALVLSRLSGLDAASSVNAITAAVNSYRKEGLSTTEVVNKLANVDAGFAVSSADLAEALSRVGSSASDAGVSFDELIALVTSAQQTTARGGAVIGNSLKTIFTRLSRSKTRELFSDLGISTVDEQGQEKNQIALLKDLAGVYGTLGTEQKNYVAEQVGGVFQLNILKAALADLGRSYSVYDRALGTSLGTTDEAEKRNTQLNKTLAGLGAQTAANVQSAVSTVGEGLFAPAAKNVLNIADFLATSVNESESSGVGAQLGKGIVNGLGSFLSGPGLAIVGAVLAKLFGDFAKYGATAAQSLLGIDKAAKNQAAIQQSVGAFLQKNAGLYSSIASGQTSATAAAKQYLQVINQQTAALQAQAAIVKTVSAAVIANVGRSGSSSGPIRTPVRRTRFSGFIPNFASSLSGRDYYQQVENIGASQHKEGYRASILRSVTVHDGMGGKERAHITSREHKKTWTNDAGYKATQITPPNGFGPNTEIATLNSGFIPNFASPSLASLVLKKSKRDPARSLGTLSRKSNTPLTCKDWDILYGGEFATSPTTKIYAGAQGKEKLKERQLKKDYGSISRLPNGVTLITPSKTGPRELGVETRYPPGSKNLYRGRVLTTGFDSNVVEKDIPNTRKRMEEAVVTTANDLSQGLGLGRGLTASQIPNTGAVVSAAGTAFELALNNAVQNSVRAGGQVARIDFKNPNSKLRSLFYNAPGSYEAKQNASPDLVRDTFLKFLSQDPIANSQKGLKEKFAAKNQREVEKLAMLSLKQNNEFSKFFDANGNIRMGYRVKDITPDERQSFDKALSAERNKIKNQLAVGPPSTCKSSGFIPNFASLLEKSPEGKRAKKTEKSFGAGAVLREYKGMPYYAQPGQSKHFPTMMKQDHPEGLRTAMINSAASQGLSRGFIPNFAPENNDLGSAITAGSIESLLFTAMFAFPQRGLIAEGLKEEKIKNAKEFNNRRAENKRQEAKRLFEQKKADTVRLKQSILNERKSGKITQREAVQKFKVINNGLAVADQKLKSSFDRINNNLASQNEKVVTNNKFLERRNQQALASDGKGGFFGRAAQTARGIGGSQFFKSPTSAFGAALAAPILAETIAGGVGRETTAGRTTSAAGQGLSFALAGGAIGGKFGLLAGGLIGAGITIKEYVDASTSNQESLTKKFQEASAESTRIADLASTAQSVVSDYYQEVAQSSPNSKRAKRLRKEINDVVSQFGSDKVFDLTKAFESGEEAFSEELEKNTKESKAKEITAQRIAELAPIEAATERRSTFLVGSFANAAKFYSDYYTGKTGRDAGKYSSDTEFLTPSEVENAGKILSQAAFSDVAPEDFLKSIDQAGGAGKIVTFFRESEEAAGKFREEAEKVSGGAGLIGRKGLNEAANALLQGGFDQGRSDLGPLKEAAKNYQEINQNQIKEFVKLLDDPNIDQEQKQVIERLLANISIQGSFTEDIAKRIIEARKIIEERERAVANATPEERSAKIRSLRLAKTEAYFQRGGEGFADIISRAQQQRSRQLEAGRIDPSIPTRAEEAEIRRQNRINKTQRKIDVLKQYGIKAPMADLESIISEAYTSRMSEIESLGLTNIPGLSQQVYDNIRSEVLTAGARPDEIQADIEKRSAAAQNRREQNPAYIQALSEIKESTYNRAGIYEKDSEDKTRKEAFIRNPEAGKKALQERKAQLLEELKIQEEAKSMMEGEQGLTAAGAFNRIKEQKSQELAGMGDPKTFDEGAKKTAERFKKEIKFAEEAGGYLEKNPSFGYSNLAGSTEAKALELNEINTVLTAIEEGSQKVTQPLSQPWTAQDLIPKPIVEPLQTPIEPTTRADMQPASNLMSFGQQNLDIPSMVSDMLIYNPPNFSLNPGQNALLGGAISENLPIQPNISQAQPPEGQGAAVSSFDQLISSATSLSQSINNLDAIIKSLDFNNQPSENNNQNNNQPLPGINQPNNQPTSQSVTVNLEGNIPEPKVEVGSITIDVSNIDSIGGKLGQVEAAINGGLAQVRQKIVQLENKIQQIASTSSRNPPV